MSLEEVKHVLDAVTVPGIRVLDPLMGEGTTGIGALELGVYFTGIEIDKERCDKAYSKLSKFASIADRSLNPTTCITLGFHIMRTWPEGARLSFAIRPTVWT